MTTDPGAEYDVAVIGSGSVALSIVVALAGRAPDCRIGLVGTPRGNGCASRASGAMLGVHGEVTPLLLRSAPGRAKVRMGRAADRLWPQWLETLRGRIDPARVPSIRRGTYVILNSRSGRIDERHFAAIIEALRADDEPFEEVDPGGIEGLEPVPSCRPLRALYLQNEGCIDSGRMLEALDACLDATPSVRRIAGRARALEPASGGRHRVRLESGQVIVARHVVIAAGTSSCTLINSVAELAGRIPPVLSGVGCSVLLGSARPMPKVIRKPNRAYSCGLHAMSRDDGTVYVGATNNVFPTESGRPMVSDVTFLLQCAIEQVCQSLQDAELLEVRVGNRPVSLDTFPLLGPTSVAGLWLATGTYRDGFHSAPLIGRIIASGLLEQADPDFEPLFTPERPPHEMQTRDEAIELTIEYAIATAHERGLVMPGVGQWEALYTQMTRERIRAAYDALGTSFVMPPDFVWESDRFQVMAQFREYYQALESVWGTPHRSAQPSGAVLP